MVGGRGQERGSRAGQVSWSMLSPVSDQDQEMGLGSQMPSEGLRRVEMVGATEHALYLDPHGSSRATCKCTHNIYVVISFIVLTVNKILYKSLLTTLSYFALQLLSPIDGQEV